jgi:UDP-N-acetylglucosamine 2-epimerase (non-hydrolysing)
VESYLFYNTKQALGRVLDSVVHCVMSRYFLGGSFVIMPNMFFSRKKSYLVVVGARPNFIKVAPLLRKAVEFPDLSFTLLHTGQHFDENMSKVFFDDLHIRKPDIQLDSYGEFHTEKIGKMFSGLKKVIKQNRFDAVIVVGDVNSTLAGAVATGTRGVKLIHIEAGLRSHDRRMPEEINRVVTDHVSSKLFITEPSARENLLREGIPEDRIHYVGNLMIESLELFKESFLRSPIVDTLGLKEKQYVVATIHRQENTDDPKILSTILTTLKEIRTTWPVVLPLHPGTKNKIQQFGLEHALFGIQVTSPLGYIDFMKLIISSKGVVTDSGGIQEETSHLGVPCATLRDNTERPITLTRGSNKLFPLNQLKTSEVIDHLARTDFKKGDIPLWDTQVSERILKVLS